MGVMIQEPRTHAWRVCERTPIVKNGPNRCGNEEDHGKDCGTSRVLTPKPVYWASEHQTTCSNWMTSGVVCRRTSTNGGCGQQCAAEPATSSPLPLETEARATRIRFWQAIPHDYKHCHTFGDCWHVSHHVFPPAQASRTLSIKSLF